MRTELRVGIQPLSPGERGWGEGLRAKPRPSPHSPLPEGEGSGRRQLRRAGLLALALSLGACAGLGSRPAPTVYLLDPPLDAPARTAPAGKVLSVALPRSAPGFDRADMLYQRVPYTLEAYTQSVWADTPARMLLPLMVRRLEAGNRFAAVLAAPAAPVSGEWRLDSEVLRFQQEFDGSASQVRLTLRAQLLDMSQRAVIATQVFDITEPAPSPDAAGGVEAANRAVARLLDQLAAFASQP